MENIVSRSAAKISGATSYFTGQPCRNGHVAMRYTQSGTCAECIKASSSKTVNVDAIARRAFKQQLIQAKFRLFDIDRETFAFAVWSMTAVRCPQILMSDIESKNAGLDRVAGTGMYTYYLHVDDHAVLFQLALSLTASHRARDQVAATKREVLRIRHT